MITNLDMASDDPDVSAMNCSFTETEMFVRQKQGEEWQTFVLTKGMAEQLRAGIQQFLAPANAE